MITRNQLEEIKVFKVVFESLEQIDKGFVVDSFIKSRNTSCELSMDQQVVVLLDQFCKYNFWSERTLGSIFRDLPVHFVMEIFKEHDEKDNYIEYSDCFEYVNSVGRKNLSDFSKYEDVDWTIDSYPELIATAFRLFENPDHDKWRSDDKDEQNDLVKIVYSKALHFMLLGGHDTLTKDEYSDISMHISEIELFD